MSDFLLLLRWACEIVFLADTLFKRGLILHGLPGNGKTISIKALMRSLALRSPAISTLYVKSLGKSSDHDDIRSIFEKARESVHLASLCSKILIV